MRGCWAKEVSKCNGPLSREHVVSKCLLDLDPVAFQGFGWCSRGWRQVSRENAVAKALCRYHNSELSSLDTEAGRLRHAIHGTDGPIGGQIWTGPPATQISGPLISRWCAKTYCNFSRVEGLIPSQDFAFHAFGLRAENDVFFYEIASEGLHLNVGVGDYRFACLRVEDGHSIFYCRFLRFDFLLANFDCRQRSNVVLPFSRQGIETKYLALNPSCLVVQDYLGDDLSVPASRIDMRWDFS